MKKKKINYYRVKIINQKKNFYCFHFPIVKKFTIRTKKNFSQIDLQKELENFNGEIDLDYILSKIEYLKNFSGYMIIFSFRGAMIKTGFEEADESMLGMFFVDVKEKTDSINALKIIFFKLNTKFERDTMLFILKFFLEDDNKYYGGNIEVDVVSLIRDLPKIYIDSDSIVYAKFENLDELITYLEKLKFKVI